MYKQIALGFALAAGFALSASAEFQYWVSVSSFQDQAKAELGRDKALQSFNSAEVQQATVKKTGATVYRVVLGPYSTKAIAEADMRLASSAGYNGAWLFGRNSSNSSAATSYSSSTYSPAASTSSSSSSSSSGGSTDSSADSYTSSSSYDSSSSSSDYSSSDYASTDSYQSVQPDYAPATASSEFGRVRPDREPAAELVTEAPPGHNLHRLYRRSSQPIE